VVVHAGEPKRSSAGFEPKAFVDQDSNILIAKTAGYEMLALASGFQMHLAKPINFDVLLDEVRKLYTA
jgi:hypothetical protein